MLHKIELPKNKIPSLSNLDYYSEHLSPGAGVINLFSCPESNELYIIGHWRHNPILSVTERKQLSLGIGGKIDANQPIDSQLVSNLALKSCGVLKLEYANIVNNPACMFIHPEWNMCYLTCVQEQEIESLDLLKAAIAEINANNKFAQYGIYHLSSIQQACAVTAFESEDKKTSVNIYNHLTGADDVVVVFDDMASNVLLNANSSVLELEKLPPEMIVAICNVLPERDRARLSETSRFFNDFSWNTQIKYHFSISDEDIAKLNRNAANVSTPKESKIAVFGNGAASLYKRCLEIKDMFSNHSDTGGVFWRLSNGYNSEEFENMILATIFASPVLFKYVFTGFNDMSALFWIDPLKVESVFNVLMANEDLFNHYIPNNERLIDACKLFGEKYSPFLKEKFNALAQMEVEEKQVSCNCNF